jgi:thioredoxin-dependent peroxiredoxin
VLEVGKQAPDFTLQDKDGTDVTLSEWRGRPVVVYFFPRADTPGCTTQACGIRDQWSEFESAGAAVLGISPDEVADQAAFAAKHGLPQRLLADPDAEVIKAWGAWGPRQAYGREFEGVIRSTVLVGPDGSVVQVWPKVQPTEHADDVLAAIGALAA